MDDFSDDRRLRVAQGRVRRAAEAVADAKARLERCESVTVAARERCRKMRAWLEARREAHGDQR
ncbi:hypothetical protein [Azospirillum sp. BE72]|uniref:hypothetical protein n=1 Tax=Azospirillum sp. BE72 TaxID=2817776 RepID=UPI00285FFFD2|nr:hypothetical protein [Azospirillum sp. BE72]MDR6775723.1 hypothetical protein [Azospirillum sp. BE72]